MGLLKQKPQLSWQPLNHLGASVEIIKGEEVCMCNISAYMCINEFHYQTYIL